MDGSELATINTLNSVPIDGSRHYSTSLIVSLLLLHSVQTYY